LVATPFHLKSFEVVVVGSASSKKVEPHDTSVCKTTYSDLDSEPESTNPIVGKTSTSHLMVSGRGER
jgi:hypothetical protein